MGGPGPGLASQAPDMWLYIVLVQIFQTRLDVQMFIKLMPVCRKMGRWGEASELKAGVII